MSENRHPAGTSIGGQWAPGAAGEVEHDLTGGQQTDPEQFMNVGSPPITMDVTHEHYESDHSDHSVDVGSERVDIKEWAHSMSVEDLRNLDEDFDDAYEEGDAIFYEMQSAGRTQADEVSGPFRVSIDQDQLRDYIAAREAGSLDESLVPQVRMEPLKLTSVRSKTLVDGAGLEDMNEAAMMPGVSIENRSDSLRRGVHLAADRYVDACRLESWGHDPDVESSMRDLADRPVSENRHEDALETLSRFHSIVDRQRTRHQDAEYHRRRRP